MVATTILFGIPLVPPVLYAICAVAWVFVGTAVLYWPQQDGWKW